MKAAELAFRSVRMLPVIHGFWLGYVRIDALIDDAGDWGSILLNAIEWITEHIPVQQNSPVA